MDSGGFEAAPGEGDSMQEPLCNECGAKLGEQHAESCSHDGVVHVDDLVGSAAPEGEMPEQVHIAGPDLTVSGVQRQRCAWCGAVILEYNLSRLSFPVREGEEPPSGPAMFAPGALVLLAGTAPRMATLIEPTQIDGEPDGVFRIPENSCMALDVEITR